MADDVISRFNSLMVKADSYHMKAQWQEKLRTLQDALSYCNTPGFPDASQRKQQVLFEMGGIRRRFGQYDRAIENLQQALNAYEHASPIMRATILGELGVAYRHKNDFIHAQKAFDDQCFLAREAALVAEAEICRALGNGGMSAYNLSQQKQPQDKNLLQIALTQLQDSITRAQNLHQALLRENPQSKYLGLSKIWETIGMDRLTLCYIAAGDTAEAVRKAEESQRTQLMDDPTVKAFSRFFYGNALWHNNQRDEALQQWNPPAGTCTSAMALCKEPCADHIGYLKLLVEAGLSFESYDEQGFSALDYAVLSDTDDAKDMVKIIVDASRTFLWQNFGTHDPPPDEVEKKKRIEDQIATRLRQSELRRHYRTVLQEHIRPQLRTGNVDSVHNLRILYKRLLAEDQSKRDVFDTFDYVNYSVFRDHKRIPRSFERLSNRYRKIPEDAAQDDGDNFIVFLSYRWLGLERPDDVYNTQWRRMTSAIDELLEIEGKNINRDRVGLWLVRWVPQDQ
jgi:tetratricopeptide (TPR) repeat protein